MSKTPVTSTNVADSAASAAAAPVASAASTSAPADSAVIFFDVDGTLVWTDKTKVDPTDEFNDFLPNQSVYQAFERLHQRGHHTVLCTGRPLPLVSDGLRALGFSGIIAGAGSRVEFEGQTIFNSVIPRDLLIETAERLLAANVDVLFESHQMPILLSAERHPNPHFPVPVAGTVQELEELAPNMDFCKISSMDGGSDWHCDSFNRFVAEHFVECNMGMAYELSMPGVDKGSAIRRLLQHMGRDRQNTFAFGDSENDLSMFPEVETPIAMGNGMDCVKERAAYVTGHAAEDGIMRGLEHFGLI